MLLHKNISSCLHPVPTLIEMISDPFPTLPSFFFKLPFQNRLMICIHHGFPHLTAPSNRLPIRVSPHRFVHPCHNCSNAVTCKNSVSNGFFFLIIDPAMTKNIYFNVTIMSDLEGASAAPVLLDDRGHSFGRCCHTPWESIYNAFCR